MRNKVIIVEGAQGVGKGTITNILREQMPYTNLLRLSGTSDKTKAGLSKVYEVRNSELDMILSSAGCSINYVLDRSHLTEAVYCKLGFKDYTFEKETEALNFKLGLISGLYDVHVVVLTAYPHDFSDRLIRDKPEFLNLKFDTQSSMLQQETYLEELKKIRREYPSINCYEVPTSGRDPYDIAYDLMSVVND